MSLQSGVAPGVWIDNPRALFTAVELLEETAREMKRQRRG